MLTASAGIGYLVTLNRTILDSPRVFAAILAILVLSIAYYMLARALESRMVVWQSAAASRNRPHHQPGGRSCTGRRLRDLHRDRGAIVHCNAREHRGPCHHTCCQPRSSAATRSPTGW
jgi:hypothetical protein